MAPQGGHGGGVDLERVLAHLEEHVVEHEAAVAEFVAIPSVSTDPEHAEDVRKAATWVAARLAAAGEIEVDTIETGGHPAVLGRWDGRPGAPTILVYGHMDVQPPDPLDAWATPPFELTERDGRWYGRGVSDDKASMLIPILVAESFFACGGPPVNLRFLFEAEEEIGSPNLPRVVRERAAALECDLVISADGGMWRADVPNVTTSARGMAALELRVRGPSKDLHSGRHGGGIQNPLHALVELLASLHDDGRVSVEGFYDGIEDPDGRALADVEAAPFDEGAYLREVGAPAAFGEPGFGTLTRQWYRPTLEINGVGGGYAGPGKKTVLPSSGFGKITCRLVPGQDPKRILDAVRRHLEAHRPPGVELEVVTEKLGSAAYRLRADHPALGAAETVLETVFGQPAMRVGMGGSIPIAATFHDALDADTLFFSFSTGDEDIHAPNEFYRPERFRMGLEAWARLWALLGTLSPGELADE